MSPTEPAGLKTAPTGPKITGGGAKAAPTGAETAAPEARPTPPKVATPKAAPPGDPAPVSGSAAATGPAEEGGDGPKPVLSALVTLLAGLVVAGLLAGSAAYALQSGRPAVWVSSTVVDVRTLMGDPGDFSTPDKAERAMANETLVANAAAMTSAVPGADRGSLKAQAVAGTDGLRFSASAGDGDKAAVLSRAYAATYVKRTQEALLGQIDKRQAVVAEQLEALRALPPGSVSTGQVDSLSRAWAELTSERARLAAQSVDSVIIDTSSPDGPSGLPPWVWAVVATAAVWGAAGAVLAMLWRRPSVRRVLLPPAPRAGE